MKTNPRPLQTALIATVSVQGETCTVTGRAAELVTLVVLHAALINGTPIGKAVINFAEGQARLELRRSFPPLRFEIQGRS